jgi:hypothetical protein
MIHDRVVAHNTGDQTRSDHRQNYLRINVNAHFDTSAVHEANQGGHSTSRQVAALGLSQREISRTTMELAEMTHVRRP